ncbi:MAG: PilX N-terminal domain-containing pilus assembly protein, partial [Pseudomonas sp.]|nr:PilX N-terminal domain-containing pilus assembly protein [Pseudomonas sp.]
MSNRRMTAKSERGMALLVSLVFLLLLTLIGISSMQNATLQEKMAG